MPHPKSTTKKREVRANYRQIRYFSLFALADFIAEFNKDGKYDKTAWEFWRWLDKKSKPLLPNKKVK